LSKALIIPTFTRPLLASLTARHFGIARQAQWSSSLERIAALGPGSTKAQHDPLIVPGKRQA
jgi:hypothetical protein